MFDNLSDFQGSVLEAVFDPDTQNRVVNNEFKLTNPQETLTLPTLYRSVGDNIWAELKTGNEITGLRRQLQRKHLDLLVETTTGKRATTPPRRRHPRLRPAALPARTHRRRAPDGKRRIWAAVPPGKSLPH